MKSLDEVWRLVIMGIQAGVMLKDVEDCVKRNREND